MYLGRNFILSLDGVPVEMNVSANLQMDMEFIETCSPTSGDASEFLPTTYTWKMSADGYLVANNSRYLIDTLCMNGKKVMARLYDAKTLGRYFNGEVYVESVKYITSVNSFLKYNITMRGTGRFSTYRTANAKLYQTDFYKSSDYITPVDAAQTDFYLNLKGTLYQGQNSEIIIANIKLTYTGYLITNQCSNDKCIGIYKQLSDDEADRVLMGYDPPASKKMMLAAGQKSGYFQAGTYTVIYSTNGNSSATDPYLEIYQ